MVRPAAIAPIRASGLHSSAATHVVGIPGRRGVERLWKSPPPRTTTLPGSIAAQAKTEVSVRFRYQVPWKSSAPGGMRSRGCSHEQSSETGWLIDMRPPRRSTSSTHVRASSRKSMTPISPQALACPRWVVISCPGTRVMPWRRETEARWGWWLVVLWSVQPR